jgi:hypothetical protein
VKFLKTIQQSKKVMKSFARSLHSLTLVFFFQYKTNKRIYKLLEKVSTLNGDRCDVHTPERCMLHVSSTSKMARLVTVQPNMAAKAGDAVR